jgi:hypothetical protein
MGDFPACAESQNSYAKVEITHVDAAAKISCDDLMFVVTSRLA